ncbi:nitrate reductase molybdenum cofactor assembly chaperone [Fodinicurvata sp. EGI_FJ10296]|uniref:nitrate reductase molybdenum cofactor assembly chaperone n=1 Tax=Fodinicurvata sp. EGI_FJ10296 TaxID=3231908 RepID=UPI0034556E4D
MIRTFKALSALLSYPSTELQQAIPDIRAVLQQEGLADAADRAALEPLLSDIESSDIYELQERYTFLFDRTRSLSLHLFEHVHGESRDRGQAMVDLGQHYEEHGFVPATNELPDYLPMFLEFLAVVPIDRARVLLADPLEILAALDDRLAKRETPYRAIFRTLLTIARRPANEEVLDALRAENDTAADDLDAIDREWEEAAVTFGPDSMPGSTEGGCGASRLQTRLRADMRDPRLAPPPTRAR